MIRDDTSQPSVGLDAARYLVDVQKVPAIVGLVGSGTALAVVNSVSAPNQVPTVACCAVTPALTKMAEEGKTGGYFFRTIPTARTTALAHAQAVQDKGYKKTVIMYINNDFGTGVAPDAKKAIEKLGGSVVGMVAYNENQPSYRSDVSKALALQPDSLVLVGLSQDAHRGAARMVLARRHAQRRAAQHDALDGHHQGRRRAFPRRRRSASTTARPSGPTADAFNKAFTDAYNRPPVGPGLHTMYDAAAVTLLAMQAAPKLEGPAIRDAMRAVQDPDGHRGRPGHRRAPQEGCRRSRTARRSAMSAPPAPSASTRTAT